MNKLMLHGKGHRKDFFFKIGFLYEVGGRSKAEQLGLGMPAEGEMKKNMGPLRRHIPANQI